MSSASVRRRNADPMAIFKRPVPSAAQVQTLKRNAACHQCRKRKLKCDAKRPCSTCLRSHAYLVAHATDDQPAPPFPECTFDDGAEEPREAHDETQPNRCQILEDRISELEGLLREMTMALEAKEIRHARTDGGQGRRHPGTSHDAESSASPASSTSHGAYGSDQGPSDTSFTDTSSTSPITGAHSTVHAPAPDQSWYPSNENQNFGQFALVQTTNQPSSSNAVSAALPSASVSPWQDQQLLPYDWPATLPNPEETKHLVHAFFAFNMHAGRLFHGPSFLANLDLPPTHSNFPCPPVLNAICAVGSLYTADIPPTPVHTASQYPYELFDGRWRRVASRPDSFAEQQIMFAAQGLQNIIHTGEKLFQGWQGQILMTIFYITQARWSEAYLSAGKAIRCGAAMGLTKCPQFRPDPANRLRLVQTTEILEDTENIVEIETRRNAFWISYATERQQASANSFPIEGDDDDIYQMLPVTGDKFETGSFVPENERQWAHDHEMLLIHPPSQTDSFIIYIKSTILLSRVKTFLVRYKGRFHAGDPNYFSQSVYNRDNVGQLDSRDSVAFQEVHRLAMSFRSSFPVQLRNPIQEETVDPYLFTASMAAYVAQILLHDPFARYEDPMCPSAALILSASRAILDLTYLIASTSYDVSLLDQLNLSGWNIAARVLIRFLKLAVDANNVDQIILLHSEVTFLHSMLSKAGERMPVAYRYKKFIYDGLARVCGEQFVEPLPATTYHREGYVAPADSKFVDPQPMMISLFGSQIQQVEPYAIPITTHM